MASLESPPPEALNKVTKSVITRHIEQLTFSAAAFTLWTRNFELVKLKRGDVQFDNIAIDGVFLKYLQGEEQSLTINERGTYFEVHLKNQKGWQRKLDKGMRETDLRSNCYKIYPRPDMGTACDAFRWLMFWIKWVEFFHLGHPMAEGDFLFPAVGTNGVLQPGKPLSHDTVQKWIGEATAGAGIQGTFSTHCFRCGGAQYRFMFAPVGEQWTLACLQWWGGWADGEHRDTLMWYLLDELHCYESDHSDALGPISREADVSLAGEGALTRPASTEALRMAHASLTADVAALHKTVNKVCASQEAMAGDVRDIREMFDNMSNQVQTASTSASSHVPSSPHWSALTVSSHGTSISQTSAHQCLYAQNTIQTPPTIQSIPATQSQLSTFCLQPTPITLPLVQHSRPLHSPTAPIGLFSPPSLPGDWSSRACQSSTRMTQTPRSESWEDIDWPHSWYNGPHGWKFNSKYYQRKLIAMEYLNVFQENKADFLKAYGSTLSLGHTNLLKAILAAHKEYPEDGEHRRHLVNETQGDSPSSQHGLSRSRSASQSLCV
ncbi:hypothetical protein J3A83DRAFT_4368717 [Scleroderma citrinum]